VCRHTRWSFCGIMGLDDHRVDQGTDIFLLCVGKWIDL